jgi:MtaA/CmuA family methyltransferase
MNSLERTLTFIKGKAVDRPPLHPIIMRFAAKYADVPYGRFCLEYTSKCSAAIKCANDFDLDWVTVMSDPYAEASAFGLKIEYPYDDLPKHIGFLLQTETDFNNLKCPKVFEHDRLIARVKEVETFHKRLNDDKFIVGWVEGPLAEYADLRGLSDAFFDLYDTPARVRHTCDIIFELALSFSEAQIKAGAHCIGIGDAACSQISPELYREFFFPYEKKLVEHIHSCGAMAKIHICGNISGILNDLIKTGADIIDIDHMVTAVPQEVPNLLPNQVFSGSADPVSILQNGNPDTIRQKIKDDFENASGRMILSAGCEVTPETSLENFRSFCESAKTIRACPNNRVVID